MSLGQAAQAVAAFVMVQTGLNWLVDNYPGLAECLSSVNRVGALLLALDEIDRNGDRQSGDGQEMSELVGQRDYGDRACVVSESGPLGQPRSLCSHIVAPGSGPQH
jgi:hypothetical protein